jgi:hypothetical protein
MSTMISDSLFDAEISEAFSDEDFDSIDADEDISSGLIHLGIGDRDRAFVEFTD